MICQRNKGIVINIASPTALAILIAFAFPHADA
jgi:hypothetical protein